jgi:hypothetical protein
VSAWTHPGQPAPPKPWDDPPGLPPQPGPTAAGRSGHPDLDTTTGLLLAGATALAEWGRELSAHPGPPESDPLAESRAVARRVANLLTGGVS